MDGKECQACMLAELKVLVEKLGSSKTDEEAEKMQKAANDLMSTCRISDDKLKIRKWNEIKPQLDDM